MDSNLDINSIRKAAVSRRGGVRTRGGRLPPIRIGNIPGLVTGSSSKKVFVPKIPQRRVKVKEDSSEPVPQPSTSSNTIRGNSRQRGRGRGVREKVFLQTEGSFLGEGPALKIKKEFRSPVYDKASYISETLRSKKVSLREIDSSIIDELLKPYDEEEFNCSTLNPIKFPLVKPKKDNGESKLNIKKEDINPAESFEKLKTNIDQVVIKTETEPFIKQEPKDDYELDSIDDKDSIKKDFDSKKDLKDIKLFQEDRKLILLQLPTCLPFIKSSEASNKDKPEKKSSETFVEKENNLASIKDLSEGCIGKLQIMKSGRMRIIFGSSVFILEEEVGTKSLWEAASISLTDGCKGNVAILGKIKCIMNLRPVL